MRILRFLSQVEPSRLLFFGYLMVIILGFMLLSFPIVHSKAVPSIDNFFIATSAVSTTGLATISVSDNYNLAGQIIILILIQIGGIGYMSLGSFIVLGSKKRISRLGSQLLKTDFSLENNTNLIDFVKAVIGFSFAIELIGAFCLYFIFRGQGEDQLVWNAIFHSISAFCTAGFSLFNTSFEAYSGNFALNLVISVLSILGSIGFIVFVDIYHRIIGKKSQITFTSRIIIRFTAVVVIISTFVVLVSETGLAGFAQEEKILISFFQAMTALTTVGFNTYSIGTMSHAVLFLITILMLTGASPSGTGGGIKSTTITALIAVTNSTLRGRDQITFRGCEIPDNRIRFAATNFFFYTIILTLGIFLLNLTEDMDMFKIIFEATSALGTVGLSMGITGELSNLGKILIIILMTLGRIGAITFGLAIMKRDLGGSEEKEKGKEDLVI